MVREREWKIQACSTCTVENDNGFMKITFLRSCNTNRLDNFPMYCITDQMKAVCKICICIDSFYMLYQKTKNATYISLVIKRREQEKLHLLAVNKRYCIWPERTWEIAISRMHHKGFPSHFLTHIQKWKKNGVFRYIYYLLLDCRFHRNPLDSNKWKFFNQLW